MCELEVGKGHEQAPGVRDAARAWARARSGLHTGTCQQSGGKHVGCQAGQSRPGASRWAAQIAAGVHPPALPHPKALKAHLGDIKAAGEDVRGDEDLGGAIPA